MTTEVEIRRGRESGHYVLMVDDRQFHLLRRAVIVFSYREESAAVRALVTGAEDIALAEPLQLGVSYDAVVPGPVELTFAQLHAVYGILTSLPTVTWTEEEFVERVGDFRETVLGMALLLRSGLPV
ncbi:hypothetical protein [Streptomyces sp. NP-1717]|uniref:hypothetical protein n=1 Tax=Streptomyces sp. NP-1717 TaxID=2704470 RepID=UPI001F5DDD88|nr:hypothetical protein [Streptomyces sp. NP-1717]MCI3221850.1 hypothetical protein [Streptomyces sp. NP-1717]